MDTLMMHYEQDPAPGLWEHKAGIDCEFHGENIVVARPKGSVQKHECVQCLLEVAAVLRAQEEKKQ